ncbi:helix-turn-helix domain-containing protein [Paenibacillus albiflavus]|nr:helix-turn-helix transcriptional regulator [Paenibacillus albiflavus]
MTSKLGYGEFIKQHRLESGFKSQRQLADITGISSATLSRIEAEVQRPHIETLGILANHLHTTNLRELMDVSGYLEGLTDEKKNSVTNFFEIHKDLDADLKKNIETIFYFGIVNEMIDVFEETLGDYIEEYIVENKLDALKTDFKGVLEFIRYADLPMESKADLNLALQNIIQKSQNKNSAITTQVTELEIDLEKIDKFNLIFCGQKLSHDEANRVKDLLVAALKMLRD